MPFVLDRCPPQLQQRVILLMEEINALQHPDCLDACGNAITLPGISHSGSDCP